MEKRIELIPLGICILVCLINAATSGHDRKDPCQNLVACGAGRKCQLTKEGLPECVCLDECPAHGHQVCGSNNRTYVNHCHLHREACLKEQHLSVKHKGACAKDKESEQNGHSHKKKAADKEEIRHSKDSSQNAQTVDACLKEDRDLLRSQIISLFRDQPGVASGKIAYNDLVFGYHFTCDIDKDNFLNATEFLDCIKDNVTFTRHNGQVDNLELFRALCIDAIINIVDKDFDRKLNSTEFNNFADADYKAQDRDCYREDKTYTEGQEYDDNCAKCICACGRWTCTFNFCDPVEETNNA